MLQHNKTIQEMINFDDAIKEYIKEHNPNWTEIPDHPYRILIIWLWIWKKKFIIQSDKSTTDTYKNLFIC